MAIVLSSVRVVAKEGLKYNPLGADVFLETGKVVGQNGTRLAGQVIVGVSAAFLAWDVIDLGWNVAELIRKKGSQVKFGTGAVAAAALVLAVATNLVDFVVVTIIGVIVTVASLLRWILQITRDKLPQSLS